MSKKIIFFFPPTGMPASAYYDAEVDGLFSNDVIRVYVQSCTHKNLGNGYLIPNLEVAARNISRCFDAHSKIINFEILADGLDSGLWLIKGCSQEDLKAPIVIDKICLQGYSRGAVTAFAVAKQLDHLDIPIHILADRPVSGDVSDSLPGTMYAKYNNLSECKNIHSALTLLAAHDLQQGFIHNTFFKQMLPKYPQHAQIDTKLLPCTNHFESTNREYIKYNLINEHMRLDLTAANKLQVDLSSYLKTHYSCKASNNTYYYTPEAYRQQIFAAGNPVPKDKLFLDGIRHNAQIICNKNKIQLPNKSQISDEQACAIHIIGRLKVPNESDKLPLLNFVLTNTNEAKQLIQIVTNIHESCVYLEHATANKTLEEIKPKLIAKAALDFKIDVFMQSFAYLNKANKTETDKRAFIASLKQAQTLFENQALNYDRGIGRKILYAVVNLVLVVTGLFVFANTLNKMNNGNWLFFSETRSTQVMRETLKDCVALAL
ncbi:MAG: hypothetical protein WC627_13470 [Legionella sp.]